MKTITKTIFIILIALFICTAITTALDLTIRTNIFNNLRVNNNIHQNQQQNQDQNQQQNQDQNQQQGQQQSNYQNVNVVIPQKNNEIKTLDVGEINFTRLLGKDEVVTYPLDGVSVITVRSAYPLAVYTIASQGDVSKVDSKDSMPWYNWIYHKFEFGLVSPIDQIPYYTTKGTLLTSARADYVVLDNRKNSIDLFSEYNLVEVSVNIQETAESRGTVCIGYSIPDTFVPNGVYQYLQSNNGTWGLERTG